MPVVSRSRRDARPAERLSFGAGPARHLAFGRILLGASLLGVIACAGPEPPSALLAPAGYGLIEGRITDPGGPVEASLSIFEAITRQGSPSYQIRVETDSTGAFWAPVPYGAYFLRVSGPGSVEFSYGRNGPMASPGESLRIAPGSERIRADFALGGLRLRVPVPAGWTGDRPRAMLERPVEDPLHSQAALRPRVVDGVLEADFRGLPEGRYIASLSFPGSGVPSVYLPPGTHWSTADRIPVQAGRWTDAAYTLPPPSTLRGAVRGSWQELERRLGSYEPPAVALFTDDSSRAGTFFPEPSGEFTGQTFRRGFVRVGVSLSGLMAWSGGRTFAEATRYELVPGAEITIPELTESGVLFHLEGEGGRVPWASRCRLALYDAAGTLLAPQAGSGESSNLLAVSNLPPGAYLFRLVTDDRCGDPWLPTWYPGEVSPDSAVPVRIEEPGQLLDLTWTLRPGGEIAWVLEGDLGAEIGEYQAKLYAAADSTSVICRANTWTGGEPASLVGLADGDYALAAYVYRDGRWRRWWYPGVNRHGSAATILVRHGARVDLGAWRIPE